MKKRPNVLLIVADDLGYSDLGCYGGEIHTPNIDKLAEEGLRFSDFHSAAMCSPTRSMLLSGTDCHLAGVGVMFEVRGADPVRFNRRGHEGFLNHDVAALPELMQDAGYHTMMSGKWHLGFKGENVPAKRGFDRSWALLPACSNHFGWEPTFEGGHLGRPRVPGLLPMLYTEDDKKWEPTPNYESDHSKGFYSTTYSVDNLLSYMKEQREDPTNSDKPFFAYLPFASPHWPLQCPPEDRDRYHGLYDEGPSALRLRRLKGLQDKGLVAENVKPHDVVAKTPEWEDMTPEERKMSSRSMEVFAGMVDRIDQEVGKVLRYLEEIGEKDNTIIMFMSDNGAEGGAYEAAPVMGPKLMGVIDKFYNNAYDNIGDYNSFVWYGPRWAQASTAPHRLYKSFSTEGGIRVPFVIRYPPLTKNPGTVLPAFTTCMDIMPTLLELAGATHPNSNPSTPTSRAPYRGHSVYPMRGKSWIKHLTSGQGIKATTNVTDSDVYAIWDENSAVGWELHGRSSLRKGKWKIVNIPYSQFGTGTWQLYNLSTDLGETRDLADEYPEIMKDMLEEWARYVEETGTIPDQPWQGPGGPPKLLPSDMVGGDPTEDMRAWMRVGHGKTLIEREGVQADVEGWKGFNE